MPPSDDPFFDLVVIGGGILGLTTTLLARRERPEWSVLVIDRGMPGGGATRWSAALSVAFAPSPRHRELVQESLVRFGERPMSAYVRKVPALVVISRAAIDNLQSGILTEPLTVTAESDREALRKAYPDLLVHESEEMLTASRGVFTVDVRALVHDALVASRQLACWSGACAVRVRQATRGLAVETKAGPVAHASRVVIATGPWPPPPVEGAPAPDGIRVKRVAALHFARPAGEVPAVFFPETDCFLLPERHNILFSFPRDVWLRRSGEVTPDFGPSRMHATAGAALVGARRPLVAFNLELAPPAGVAQAREIASLIREGGVEGLPGVRAIGVELRRTGAPDTKRRESEARSAGSERGETGTERCPVGQVSINVERPAEIPLSKVVWAVRRHAPVARAELVGMAPRVALEGFPDDVSMPGFDPARHVIENALGLAGIIGRA